MNLLFDLDGTLTDPFRGITRCIAYALDALGRPSPAPEDLRWCIGPPLKESFEKLLGSKDDRVSGKALAKYRERFSSIGLFENQVYPGIAEALGTLKGGGHTLYIVTSKPTSYADRIVVHFGLDEYFHRIYGSELDGKHSDKTSLILHVLRREAILPPETIMIGDREHDMLGARNNRIRGIGVLWGYGTREELQRSGALALAGAPGDLVATINEFGEQTEAPGAGSAPTRHDDISP
jgi:phosphoglycolate phosphatase